MLKQKIYIWIAAMTFLVGFGLSWLIFGGAKAQTGEDHSEHSAEAHAAESSEETIWTCSMDPQIRQNEPGKCPICGMDLIPAESDAGDAENPAVLEMTESAVQLANIQTKQVETGEESSVLDLDGRVQADESRIHSQAAHFPGRIERLFVNFTGEYVRKGQKIAEIYSPELIAAQEELLEALKFQSTNPTLVAAARKKLKRWKVSDQIVKDIEKNGKVITDLPVYADFSGTILKKKVNHGDHLHTGEVLFDLANLNNVWVEFEVHERDLARVRKGDALHFHLPSFPQKTFEGKVSFIDPVVDRKSRITLVRTVVLNTDQMLKPGMYVKGQVSLSLKGEKKGLYVPKSAVMWTGKRSVVYVKIQGNVPSFEMREVTLGQPAKDAWLITEGLRNGEEIVVNGTFTVDAAAQLANKTSMMNRPVQVAGEPQANSQKEPLAQYSSSSEFKSGFDALLDEYFVIKDAFVASNAMDAAMSAGRMIMEINAVKDQGLQEKALNDWETIKIRIGDAASIISGTKDLKVQRKYFIELSEAFSVAAQRFGTGGNKVYLQRCPMADNNNGADWLSKEFEIRNPYFGDAMLTCGSVKQEIQ